MTNDPDYLGDDLYRGDKVWWHDHNRRGDDPRCTGTVLAKDGDTAWIKDGHGFYHSVNCGWLLSSEPATEAEWRAAAQMLRLGETYVRPIRTIAIRTEPSS